MVTRPDSHRTPGHEQGVVSATRQRRERPPTAERMDSSAALSAARSGADIGRRVRRKEAATATRTCSCMFPVFQLKTRTVEAPREEEGGKSLKTQRDVESEGPVNGGALGEN